MQFTIDALGTKWWVTLPSSTPSNLTEEIKNTTIEFEDNYSRFKATSLIGQLNENKMLINPTGELVNMLNYALDVYKVTNGIFNISVGSKLERLGYGIKVDKSSKVSSSLLNDIDISKDKITISEKIRLDLGGFGKGWLIEKLAGLLRLRGADNFIINGGGDIAVYGNPEKIYIGHPTDEALQIGEVILKNKSLASSSNLKRTWTHKGKRQTHIVHPKNKMPNNVLSIHVLAESILFADTFATVFMLMPRSQRLELSHKYGLEFLEILPDFTTFQTSGFKIQLNK